MPEKKIGMFGIFRGVFKSRKSGGDDIVYRAEMIVEDYIEHRRGEIISKYGKKSHTLRNFCIFMSFAIGLFLIYKALS